MDAKAQDATEPAPAPAGAIYRAIPAIMAEVGHIAKGRQATEGGPKYKYRGVDDFYKAFQPLLAAHGVFVAPTVLEQRREERATQRGGVMTYTILSVRFTFWASDGSHVECVTVGEAMDTSDKSSNKAMSAAMKYAFILTFSIPIDDPDQDTESAHHEPTQRDHRRDDRGPPDDRDLPVDGRRPGPGWERGTRPDSNAGQAPRGQAVREGGRVSQGAAKAGEIGGGQPGDLEAFLIKVGEVQTMDQLRALAGQRDKLCRGSKEHEAWKRFLAKYKELQPSASTALPTQGAA